MPDSKTVREASHAGSWYSDSKAELNSQLDGWLASVHAPVTAIGPQTQGDITSTIPQAGARVIIAPHAGYSYSGPAAAWAYKSWDVSKAAYGNAGLGRSSADEHSKRVFLLGPSHHHYLSKAALSQCSHYATPLGDLVVDRATTSKLYESGHFEWMSQSVDEDEHSLEMHLPYIYKMLSRQFGDDAKTMPALVPIMIGNTSGTMERTLGKLLAPYLTDPETAFVISSDFAHWGTRFRYTYYRAASGTITNLGSTSRSPKQPEIHESIKAVDFECMGACESGSHAKWLDILEETGNTVCGRHPIGVIMAAIEQVRKDIDDPGAGAFKFLRYERSSEVRRVSDSSVSYASAVAVI